MRSILYTGWHVVTKKIKARYVAASGRITYDAKAILKAENARKHLEEEIPMTKPKPKDSKLIKALLKTLHVSSSNHKKLLEMNYYNLCGCFYCRKVFTPEEIRQWTDKSNAYTAFCPHCRIDSVIPLNDEVDNEAVLTAMSEYFFSFTRKLK